MDPASRLDICLAKQVHPQAVAGTDAQPAAQGIFDPKAHYGRTARFDSGFQLPMPFLLLAMYLVRAGFDTWRYRALLDPDTP